MLTGDDFEVIDSADNIATRAASGSIPPVPQQALTPSSPAPSDSDAPQPHTAPETPDSPLAVTSPKAAGVTVTSALVLTADALTVNIQQQVLVVSHTRGHPSGLVIT